MEKAILQKINQLHQILSIEAESVGSDYSLLRGKGGIALFQYRYSKLTKKQFNGRQVIDDSFKLISTLNVIDLTYYSGLPGLVWLYNYFEQQKIITSKFDEVSPVYIPLIQDIKIRLEKNEIDFLHGSIGQMYTLVGRISADVLGNILERLIKNSKVEKIGISWPILRGKYSYYNFGHAHGISSIIKLLCKSIKNNIASDLCVPILRGTCEYVISKKNKNQFLNLYPEKLSNNFVDCKYEGRLAWCWGDIGIALAFLEAAEVLRDEVLFHEAKRIALSCLKRNNPETTGVVDACVCHGSSGIALFYKKFYLATRNTEFYEAYTFWIKLTLNMAQHSRGIAGYKTFNGANQKWENKNGILEGVAGIGLTLVNYFENEEQEWFDCLLL